MQLAYLLMWIVFIYIIGNETKPLKCCSIGTNFNFILFYHTYRMNLFVRNALSLIHCYFISEHPWNLQKTMSRVRLIFLFSAMNKGQKWEHFIQKILCRYCLNIVVSREGGGDGLFITLFLNFLNEVSYSLAY